jgi:protein-tyrosine phosphatase
LIDIHTHILPGFDDGAESPEVAVEMARAAASEGISRVVATPHIMQDDLTGLRTKIEDAVSSLNKRLRQESVDVEILPGAEVHVSAALVTNPDALKDISLGFRENYVLLELPLQEMPRFTEELIFRVQLKGFVPVLAHPERNASIIEQPSKLLGLVEKGALVQVNAGSVTGKYGEKVRITADLFMRNRLIHFLASDAHSLRSRPLKLREAVERAKGVLGDEGASALVEQNPAAALAGRTIEVTFPRHLKRSGRGPLSWFAGRTPH